MHIRIAKDGRAAKYRKKSGKNPPFRRAGGRKEASARR
jgi:hypothetical protein